VIDRRCKHQRSPFWGARPGLQYIEGIRRRRTAAWSGITRTAYSELRQLIMGAGSTEDDLPAKLRRIREAEQVW